MRQLEALGIRNLRSFADKEQLINLKNINILVGKNSCGKSTFARVFPLLKQSLVAKTSRTPMLWNGSMIDFGDFTTAVRDGEHAIFFDFQFNFNKEDISGKLRKGLAYARYFHDADEEIDREQVQMRVSLEIEQNANNKSELINTVSIFVHDVKVSFKYSDSIFYNDFIIEILSGEKKNIFDIKEQVESENMKLSFNRTLGFFPDTVDLIRTVKIKKEDGVSQFYKYVESLERLAQSKISHNIKKYFRGGSSTEAIKNLCANIQWVKPKDFIEHLNNIFKDYKSFTNSTQKENVQSEILDEVYPYAILLEITTYINHINKYLSSFGQNINYIAPVRAVSERYYRYQNLSVDEMDSTGMNLPMVINSLSRNDRLRLSEWIQKNFKFQVELKVTGQHYEILIKSHDDSKFHNISDMGFGYSQLLPIIVSIWLKNKDKYQSRFLRRGAEQTYVIEQPELHLHPALQYQFGCMLAKVIQESAHKDIQFIIETHSKSIIDAIGEEIQKNNLSSEDVGIYLFEKDDASQTQIRRASFSKEGFLQDWPLGFLTA